MTQDWWDEPAPNFIGSGDPNPRFERPLDNREARRAIWRGVQIALRPLATVAVLGLLLLAIRPPPGPGDHNGPGVVAAVPSPARSVQASVARPAASRPTARTATPTQVVPSLASVPPSGGPTFGSPATVIRVVDGDTIHALINGDDENVRIIGLDSPESRKPGTPVECMALEATAAAKSLLTPGDNIFLQSDPTQDQRDRYDRLLAHVILANGDLFAEKMIEQGWAIHYIYNGVPSIYSERLALAQARAMFARAGLWSPTTCNGNAHAPSAAP